MNFKRGYSKVEKQCDMTKTTFTVVLQLGKVYENFAKSILCEIHLSFVTTCISQTLKMYFWKRRTVESSTRASSLVPLLLLNLHIVICAYYAFGLLHLFIVICTSYTFRLPQLFLSDLELLKVSKPGFRNHQSIWNLVNGEGP